MNNLAKPDVAVALTAPAHSSRGFIAPLSIGNHLQDNEQQPGDWTGSKGRDPFCSAPCSMP